MKINCSTHNCDNDFNPNYEGHPCPYCGREFCEQCVADKFEMCENCGIWGCNECVKQDSETGFYFCGDDCRKELKNECN